MANVKRSFLKKSSISLFVAFISIFLLSSCNFINIYGAESSSTSSNSTSSSAGDSTISTFAPITFNFIEEGDCYSGDCAYIKAGDNDILIDAGNRTSSAAHIEDYLDDSSRQGDYVEDGKLEYVIATHAHQDHIAGFVGSGSDSTTNPGILYKYSVDTLIDFPQTQATSKVYSNYLTARNYAISKGTKHYTALQCWNETDGASKVYTLGQGLTMQILYNFYYDHTPAESSSLNSSFTTTGFSSENDYSVSVLFTQGTRHFLFTGDSEAYAEYSLVKYNDLPKADLFKAGHHGSYTANTTALLSVIQPRIVCVTCCAGNQEYAKTSSHSFPAQESIDRIAPYTDRVYCTTLGSWDDSSAHTPMNGNIVVSYDEHSSETIHCSNNDTLLKDTDWFKNNRTMPSAWNS